MVRLMKVGDRGFVSASRFVFVHHQTVSGPVAKDFQEGALSATIPLAEVMPRIQFIDVFCRAIDEDVDVP